MSTGVACRGRQQNCQEVAPSDTPVLHLMHSPDQRGGHGAASVHPRSHRPIVPQGHAEAAEGGRRLMPAGTERVRELHGDYRPPADGEASA